MELLVIYLLKDFIEIISFESDYFSLSVIIYELINFERPFKKEKKYEVIEEFENNKINLNKMLIIDIVRIYVILLINY